MDLSKLADLLETRLPVKEEYFASDCLFPLEEIEASEYLINQRTDLQTNYGIDPLFEDKENIQDLFPHLPFPFKKVSDLAPVCYLSQTNPPIPISSPLPEPLSDPPTPSDGKILAGDSANKQWDCSLCEKTFRHQYALDRHMPIHTDERKFRCDICLKAFRQQSTLTQHKVIHSYERPFVCGFCGKTFNRISTLISHKKIHSRERPHKCPICGKGFTQKGNLRNHEFIHTNARPYKCPFCGKGFNQMSNLNCHKIRAHSEATNYFCSACGDSFSRRIHLRHHEKVEHGMAYSIPRNDLHPQYVEVFCIAMEK